MSNSNYTLYLKNYKALYTPEEPIKIDIEDITLIIGPRSSGKSSILEALWLLPELKENLLQGEEKDIITLNLSNRALFTGSKNIRIFNLVNQQSLAKSKETNSIILLVENKKLQYYGKEIYYKINILSSSSAKIKEINNEQLETLGLEYNNYNLLNINTEDPHQSAVNIHALSVHRISHIPGTNTNTTDNSKGMATYAILPGKLVSTGVGLHAENVSMIINGRTDAAQPFYELFDDIINRFIEYFNEINEKEDLPKITEILPQEKSFTIIYDDSTRIPYENLSMGTKNLLGILMEIAVVHTLKEKGVKGDFIVEIEEPELALHASTLTALTEIMKKETKYMKFILTSHSPRLLLITSAYKDVDTKSYILLKEGESYVLEIGEELGEKERAAIYPMLRSDVNLLYEFYSKIVEKY